MRPGFDLRRVDTYYTRPMSEAWSQPRDVEPLADQQAEFELAIPVADFPRVRVRLGGTVGTISGHVRFRHESGFAVAALEVTGSVELVCQRCLQNLSWPIAGSALVALIATESQVDRVPEHLEPMLALGGRISLRDLVEEEVMLGLPIVPLHSDVSVCEPAMAVGEHSGEHSTVQRPFERLDELLKRSSEASIACEETNHGRSKKS
jgi:uncharacterized protein